MKKYILPIIISLLLISGTVGAANYLAPYMGGTGLGSYSAGDIIIATSTNTLYALPKGSDGQVLKLSSGIPAWGTDATGAAGGSGVWATTTNGIYPTSDAYDVMIGNVASSTAEFWFDVSSGDLTITGGIIANTTSTFNGYVGIGTTTAPSYALDVNGSIQTNDTFYGDSWVSASGNSMAIQPTGDTDDFFSFKTPADRPTIKREGGKYIYIESSNVNDVGISFREDADHSGTLNYYKDEDQFGLTSKDPLVFKACGDYANYVKICNTNNTPELYVASSTAFKINAGGTNSLLLNHAGGSVAVGATTTSYILGLGTGDTFGIGSTQWNSADEIDGTKIKDADYGDVVIDAAGDWQVSEGEVDHDTLLNFVAGEHFLQSAITEVGTIATGTWQGTAIGNTWIASSTEFLVDNDTTYVSSDFTHDDLTGFVANEHLDWTSDLGATNIHAGNYTDTNTTYLGGTNLTLVDTTFNVDDAFLKNNANDTMVGVLTADGLTLGANENITLGSNTLDHDGTDFVFNDSVKASTAFIIGGASMSEVDLEKLDGITNGTAAANKALVLDASLDIGTINSLTATTLVGALTGNADTATALAANGANATSGYAIIGVDASGAYEGAFDVWTEAENTAASYIDATLTQAQVEDYAGGLWTGNTETLITVTYQAGDNTLDAVVNDDLSLYDNTTSTFITSSALSGYMQDEDINTFSEIQAWVTDAVLLATSSIDAFSELNTIVADKTLINEEDAVQFDSTVGITGTLTLNTGMTGILRADSGVVSTTTAGSGDITDVFDCATGDCNTMTVGTDEYLAYGTGYIDANRFAGVTTVDATEFGYLNGVTSAIQTQFGGKQSTLTNSAGLLAALSDETGTGVAVFGTSPTFTTGVNLPAGSIDTATEIAADLITHTQIADSDQTDTKCIWFEDPTADDDFKSIWANKTANDLTITEIWGESDQTVSFDLQIDDSTPADVSGTDIAPAAGEAEDTSLAGDTTLAAGEELDLIITSVSGTPTWVSICWTFHWND